MGLRVFGMKGLRALGFRGFGSKAEEGSPRVFKGFLLDLTNSLRPLP